MSGYVLLEDGTTFGGELVGRAESVTGEVVFTTGMSGYQECVTDPSFHAQIITFTYPHTGNYGVSAAAMESDRVHASGVVMREAMDGDDAPGAEDGWLRWLDAQGVPAITGVDTRALVRHIRDAGAMRGGIFAEGTPVAVARERVDAEPSMVGRDLAKVVTTPEPVVHDPDPARHPHVTRIIALDTGIKRSIIDHFTARGVQLHLYPCTTPAQELLAVDAEGVFLVPGPGDPAALDYVVDAIRALIGAGKPVFGICLGHQLLSRAVGLETFKMPFGHHGANHPVKDVRTGRIAITSQNHGFAVTAPPTPAGQRLETDFGPAAITHVNLYDGTIEGVRLLDVAVGCVQYHPEAGPGPHDSRGLFDDFIGEMSRA